MDYYEKRTITGRGVSMPFSIILAGAVIAGAILAAAIAEVSIIQINNNNNKRKGIRNNQQVIQLN